MVNVIAWPPVGLVGWEVTRTDMAAVSRGVLTNRRRTSASQARRRSVTAHVSALAMEATGSGYMAQLIEELDGLRHLVRIEARSSVWYLRDAAQAYLSTSLVWLDGSTPLLWTAGSTLVWGEGAGAFTLSGTPGTSGGFDVLTVSGLPANTLVVRPDEGIRVTGASGSEFARAVAAAWSDGSGVAVIRVRPAITIGGLVSIGETESIVLEALDVPRPVQPVAGGWTYEWSFREVFEAETDGFVEVDPWG